MTIYCSNIWETVKNPWNTFVEMLKQDLTTLEFRYFNIFSHIHAKGDFESL